MEINKSVFIRTFVNHVKHYNHDYYWKIRKEVIDPDSKYPKWMRYYWLYKIRKCDSFWNAYMGTEWGCYVCRASTFAAFN